MFERILVATDGSSSSNGAARLAQRLADRDGSRIDAITVYAPVPRALPQPGSSSCHSGVDPEAHGLARLRTSAADRARQLGAPEVAAHLGAVEGPVAPSIVREAIGLESSLILVGIGEHGPLDRWLGTETALRVAQLAHVPVLAVHPGGGDVPLSAVVGVDFSPFCEDAAHTAASLLGPAGRVHLAHAGGRPTVHQGEWVATWTEFADAAEGRMAPLKRALETVYPVAVELHVLDGDPVAELLELAAQLPADLIAVGSHGRGFLGRLLLGSVCSGLLRRAPCAVLIAPPRRVPDELAGGSRRRPEPAEVGQ